MRYVIAAMMLAAAPAAAWDGPDLSSREGCMDQLADEIRMARSWETMPKFWRKLLDQAPEAGAPQAEGIINIVSDISRLHKELADEMMDLCATYD